MSTPTYEEVRAAWLARRTERHLLSTGHNREAAEAKATAELNAFLDEEQRVAILFDREQRAKELHPSSGGTPSEDTTVPPREPGLVATESSVPDAATQSDTGGESGRETGAGDGDAAHPGSADEA